jgi:hypothetical protein
MRTPPNVDGRMLVGALSWRTTVTQVWTVCKLVVGASRLTCADVVSE